MEPDFSGYATKAGLKCSDGRTITPEAFKHMDKTVVPLVWQHGHNNPENVLGHAILEARDDGVYAYGFFNDTPAGKNSKTLVEHKDIRYLSIWANQLVEKSKTVLHGFIREVSLVLSGANPGALIDNVRITHSDGDIDVLADEAIIHTGLELEHDSGNDKTFQDVYDSLNEEQRNLVHFIVSKALQTDIEHSDKNTDDSTANNANNKNDNGTDGKPDDADGDKTDKNDTDGKEGGQMTHNVFDQTDKDKKDDEKPVLSHAQIGTILETAKRIGSLKEAVLSHADEYGITNIDLLFPDAKAIDNIPELITRRMEWVQKVINGARKSPFSRIKSLSADVTHEEARAKGYIKATKKKDEFFALAKRVTHPYTIYKKQKLDRDDIIDITDFDVVAWLKGEMRIMLDEEIARAVLVGDGREPDDPDKINEQSIRPIAHDDDFYSHKVIIPANTSHEGTIEAIIRARPKYRGAGNPTMFCAEGFLTDLLLLRDKQGRRLYRTKDELASELRVSDIVTVDVMEDQSTDGGDLLAVLVNMADYTMGADRGGNVTFFDDFDIDWNQYKYLIEGRMSGALTKHKTALVFSRGAGTLVAPDVPEFDPVTGVVTIPTKVGVVYKNKETDAVLVAGDQPALDPAESIEVVAVPSTGYYFPHNIDADWVFTRNA